DPEAEADAARAAGLEIVDLRTARLRIEIDDIGAVVYLLRKLGWWVPGYSVDRYRDRLHDLHEQILRDGPFVDHSSRHLIEARRV
ncbi:MAG: SAM-dependent methyltransferase, partial [Microbacterium sp.]|nr:SAM-dependent methyltransferase [Microbacterium sp.]